MIGNIDGTHSTGSVLFPMDASQTEGVVMGDLRNAIDILETSLDELRQLLKVEPSGVADMVLDAARQVANAVPVVRMGGLSPTYYVTDDQTEADAWLIEVKPKEL